MNTSFNSCTAIYVNQKTSDNKKYEYCGEMPFQIRHSGTEQSIIFRYVPRFLFLITLLKLFMCCNHRHLVEKLREKVFHFIQQEDVSFLSESVNSDTSYCDSSSTIHLTEEKLREKQTTRRRKKNIIHAVSALQI